MDHPPRIPTSEGAMGRLAQAFGAMLDDHLRADESIRVHRISSLSSLSDHRISLISGTELKSTVEVSRT